MPVTSTLPLVGISSPSSSLISVDLPEPVPYSGACFDLAANQMISEGVKIPVAPKELPRGHAASEGGKRAMYLANQLDLANKRLQQIINLNKGGTNRDMEKLLKQINDLCDKLDG